MYLKLALRKTVARFRLKRGRHSDFGRKESYLKYLVRVPMLKKKFQYVPVYVSEECLHITKTRVELENAVEQRWN